MTKKSRNREVRYFPREPSSTLGNHACEATATPYHRDSSWTSGEVKRYQFTQRCAFRLYLSGNVSRRQRYTTELTNVNSLTTEQLPLINNVTNTTKGRGERGGMPSLGCGEISVRPNKNTNYSRLSFAVTPRTLRNEDVCAKGWNADYR